MSLYGFKWVAVAICVLAGAALGWRKTDGWGWFLVMAFVLAGMAN